MFEDFVVEGAKPRGSAVEGAKSEMRGYQETRLLHETTMAYDETGYTSLSIYRQLDLMPDKLYLGGGHKRST